MPQGVIDPYRLSSTAKARQSTRAVALANPVINEYIDIIDDRGAALASITIRNLEDSLKSRLRVQAAVHGRSMEDEARDILRAALNRQTAHQGNLAAAIRARFAPLGGVDMPAVPRDPMREPPVFDE